MRTIMALFLSRMYSLISPYLDTRATFSCISCFSRFKTSFCSSNNFAEFADNFSLESTYENVS